MRLAAASGAPTVLLDAVSKSFGNGLVVDRVSFSVARGTCFGLLGPNGAGKSTTLKMICGFLVPSSGSIRVEGIDVARRPRDAKRRLGIVPQEDTLDPDLTVVDNLLFHARYCGIPRVEARRRAAELLARAELGARGADAVGVLSVGLRRRLVLARALLADPSVLILDEPTRGLDAATRADYLERVRGLKGAGTTVVLATHDLDEAATLCDGAAFLKGGRILRAGEPAAIVGDVAEQGRTAAEGPR